MNYAVVERNDVPIKHSDAITVIKTLVLLVSKLKVKIINAQLIYKDY